MSTKYANLDGYFQYSMIWFWYINHLSISLFQHSSSSRSVSISFLFSFVFFFRLVLWIYTLSIIHSPQKFWYSCANWPQRTCWLDGILMLLLSLLVTVFFKFRMAVGIVSISFFVARLFLQLARVCICISERKVALLLFKCFKIFRNLFAHQ